MSNVSEFVKYSDTHNPSVAHPAILTGVCPQGEDTHACVRRYGR